MTYGSESPERNIEIVGDHGNNNERRCGSVLYSEVEMLEFGM